MPVEHRLRESDSSRARTIGAGRIVGSAGGCRDVAIEPAVLRPLMAAGARDLFARLEVNERSHGLHRASLGVQRLEGDRSAPARGNRPSRRVRRARCPAPASRRRISRAHARLLACGVVSGSTCRCAGRGSPRPAAGPALVDVLQQERPFGPLGRVLPPNATAYAARAAWPAGSTATATGWKCWGRGRAIPCCRKRRTNTARTCWADSPRLAAQPVVAVGRQEILLGQRIGRAVAVAGPTPGLLRHLIGPQADVRPPGLRQVVVDVDRLVDPDAVGQPELGLGDRASGVAG